MKTISKWAKSRRPAARAAIVLLKITLAVLAWYLADLLRTSAILLPAAWLFVSALVFAVAIVYYPSRRLSQLSKGQFYRRQKWCDFVLISTTFVMMLTLFNRNFNLSAAHALPAGAAVSYISERPTAAEILKSLKTRDKKSLTRQEKKILKREFKVQVKNYAAAKLTGDKAAANESLLIILTIIGALGLAVLLAALCCHIACSGPEGLAIAIGIIGLAGIIWAAAAIIRRIKRGPRQRAAAIP